jgi:hypothetical protein
MYLQWIGYIASVIIAVSMTMSSIVKFRIINFFGASLFCIYGFLIGALPVALLNGFVMMVDLYYLYGIFSKKEVFEILEVRKDNKYLLRFLTFHQKQIQHFFPGFSYEPEDNAVCFFILRDMAVAGVFIAHRADPGNLMVNLDYVIPEYRDFKNGKFVYHRLKKEFVSAGYTRIICHGINSAHINYLKKMGFTENQQGLFEIRMDH